jgi:CHAD domain-containing protein
MKLKRSRTATVNARALLPKMAEKYFHAGREAADGARSPKEVHRFRIATKRFRYTLELFRPVYGASLDQRLTTLHDLQTTLGKLSDYRSMQQMLEGDEELVAKLKHAAKKHLKEFQDDWKEFDGEGQMERWRAYLGESRNTRKTGNTRKKAAARLRGRRATIEI